MEQYNSVSGTADTVLQAYSVGTVNVYNAPPGLVVPAEEWAELVADSAVWSRLRAGYDPGRMKQQAVRAAVELGRQRDDLAVRLADDPWQDPGVVRRYLRATEQVLGEPAADLYPAEAAFLVLLPLLYRVRSMQLACDAPSFGRDSEEHRLLADRSRDEPALVHWLLHRRLARHADLADRSAVDALLRSLPDADLRAALTPVLVRAALGGLRRGPGVANREFLHELPESDRVVCGGEQFLPVRRLVLQTALAYALAFEATALPETVADHLGIDDPVRLPQLLDTLDTARWGGSREFPVLRAECHHEAVVEALHEYTAYADELLHAVQREFGPRAATGLPLRLSSADVVPAPDKFRATARFRLNERRMRSLLMGVQLYRDRDLAVRELYQNALDACRYRRARADYLARRAGHTASTYRGSITFEQGVDEHGRPYLECHDNGIGMGEAELRGVFSKAGERFAEQQELMDERARWQEVSPPVELYPNSRFGIGVLSYFMLADRMTVATRRMAPDGETGPELAVSIHGPGHLFPITERPAEHPGPGTTVRLYLNPDVLPDEWSAVDVLERLLGIAEFETVATHNGRVARWEPNRLRPSYPRGNSAGLTAHGRFVPWAEAPPGVEVIWCEQGGGLLVDGLLVSAGGGAGRPGGGGSDNPFGVVVNLSGRYSPAQLSVDRREVLDDLSGTLDGLLQQAAHALVRDDPGFIKDRWLLTLADQDARLADLVVTAVHTSTPGTPPDSLPALVHRQGFYPLDHGSAVRSVNRSRQPLPRLASLDPLPTPWLLWRILAHRPNPLSESLIELVPELDRIGPMLTPIPSDNLFLSELGYPGSSRSRDPENRAELLVQALDTRSLVHRSRAATARRLEALKLFDWWDARPATVAELGRSAWPMAATVDLLREFDVLVPDQVLALASAYGKGDRADLLLPWSPRGIGWLEPDRPVPLGHLALAAVRSGLPLAEVAARFSELGLPTGADPLPREVPDHMVELLSRDFDSLPPWIDHTVPVPVDHVLRAATLSGRTPSEMVREFEELGLRCAGSADRTNPEFLPLVTRYFTLDDRRLPFECGPEFGSPLFEAVMRWIAERSTASPTLPGDRAFDRAVRGLLSTLGQTGQRITDAVPFAAAFPAAGVLGIAPAEFAERLNSSGIPTCYGELPPDLSEHTANRICDLVDGLEHISVRVLLRVAGETGAPLSRIADWVRLLGYSLPDVTATVREAVPFIPIAD